MYALQLPIHLPCAILLSAIQFTVDLPVQDAMRISPLLIMLVMNIFITSQQEQTYYVCITVNDSAGTCSNIFCDSVIIGNPVFGGCNAQFTLVEDSTNIYNYWAYNNASSGTGATLSYSWDFGDGTTSTLQYPSHT